MIGEIYIPGANPPGAILQLAGSYNLVGLTVATVVRFLPRGNTEWPVLQLQTAAGAPLFTGSIRNGRVHAYFHDSSVEQVGTATAFQPNVTYCLVWSIAYTEVDTVPYLQLAMYSSPLGSAALTQEMDLAVTYTEGLANKIVLNPAPTAGVSGDLVLRNIAVWPEALTDSNLAGAASGFNRSVAATITAGDVPILWMDWEYTASDLGIDLMGIQPSGYVGRHSWCGLERSNAAPVPIRDARTIVTDLPDSSSDRRLARMLDRLYARSWLYNLTPPCPEWSLSIVGRPYCLTSDGTRVLQLYNSLSSEDPFYLYVGYDGQDVGIGTAPDKTDIWRPESTQIPITGVSGITCMEMATGGDIFWVGSGRNVWRLNLRGQVCQVYVAGSWSDVVSGDLDGTSVVDLGTSADYTNGVVTSGPEVVAVTTEQVDEPPNGLQDAYYAIRLNAWTLARLDSYTYPLHTSLAVNGRSQKVFGIAASPLGQYWVVAHGDRDPSYDASVYLSRVTLNSGNGQVELHGRTRLNVPAANRISRLGSRYLLATANNDDGESPVYRACTYLFDYGMFVDPGDSTSEVEDTVFSSINPVVSYTLPFTCVGLMAPGIGVQALDASLKVYYDDLGDWTIQLRQRGSKIDVFWNGRLVKILDDQIVLQGVLLDNDHSGFLWRGVGLTTGTISPVLATVNQDVEGLLDIPVDRLPPHTLGRFLYDMADSASRTHRSGQGTASGMPVVLERQDGSQTVRRWLALVQGDRVQMVEDMSTRRSLMDALGRVGNL